MKAVEAWKCRTQTSKAALLKSPRSAPRKQPPAQLPAVSPFGGSPHTAQKMTPVASTTLLCPSWAVQLYSSPKNHQLLSTVFLHYKAIETPHDGLSPGGVQSEMNVFTASKLYKLLRELEVIQVHAELPQVDKIFGQILGCNFHRYQEITFENMKTALANITGDSDKLAALLLNQLPKLAQRLPAQQQEQQPAVGLAISPAATTEQEWDMLLGIFCHYATRTTFVNPTELWSSPDKIRFAPMNEARVSQRQLGILASELLLMPNLISRDLALGALLKKAIGDAALSTTMGMNMLWPQFSQWIVLCEAEMFEEPSGLARMIGQMRAAKHFDMIMGGWARVDRMIGHELVENFGPYDPKMDMRVLHQNIGGSALLLQQFMDHLVLAEREISLREVFRYYCSMGEDWPTDVLTLQKFIKLSSDACLIDNVLPHQMIVLVYQHVVGNKLYGMKWEDLLVGIIELVLLKFGTAPDNMATLADALDGLVLAYCHKRPIRLSLEDAEQFMAPEVMDVLLERDDLLQDLFASFTSPHEDVRLLSSEQLLDMALQFELISSWTTEDDLVEMFRLSNVEHPGADLMFTQFVELVCRLSAHAGRSDTTPAARLRAILDRIASTSAAKGLKKAAAGPSHTPHLMRNASPRAATPATVVTPRAKTPRPSTPGRSRPSTPGRSRPSTPGRSRPPTPGRSWAPSTATALEGNITFTSDRFGRSVIIGDPSAPQDDEVNSMRVQNEEEAAYTLNMLCQEDAEAVRSVFDFYCSYAESQLQTTMKSSNVYKLVRDARIEGDAVNSSNVGVIIAKCQRVGCASSRIDLTTFYMMLAEMAQRLYPGQHDSMEQFLDEYLAPLASRIVKAPVGPDQSDSDAKISGLLKQCYEDLMTLFDHYSTLQAPGKRQRSSGDWNTILTANTTISLKEVTKFAEEFDIVPSLLSKMEVGRLMRAVLGASPNNQLILDQSGFVEWVRRAALHGFSRSEYTDEYPDDAAKVEKLLKEIDSSRVLHSIKAARGKRHDALFSRHHNEAMQKNAQRRDLTERKVQRDIEQRLFQLLENKGMHDDLRRIFDFYASFGEDSKKDSMKGFMFFKLVRDCQLLDNRLSSERVDLIFAESVGKSGGRKRRARLGLNKFVLALSSLAKIKLPHLDLFDGFLQLCEDYLLPLARRADESAPVFGTFHHSAVQDLLEQRSLLLSVVFNHYARLSKSVSGATQRTMTLRDFLKFAGDFGISSSIASNQELSRIFYATVDIKEEANMEHWKQVITRCAMHWGNLKIGRTAPTDIADRLLKFINVMENSEAMIPIEQRFGSARH